MADSIVTPKELLSKLAEGGEFDFFREALLSVLREMDIGFSYWNYKNLDFGIISRGEKLHATLSQYENPERINYRVLAMLQGY